MNSRYQFTLAELFLLLTIAQVWGVASYLIGSSHGLGGAARGIPLTLFIFSGIAATAYRLVHDRRFGWAIAGIAAPIIAVTTLIVVALLFA